MLKRNALSLLDVGAGTGILGERLSATGFTNLQAIDLAPKMLAIAEKKRLYKRIVCDSLYNWQKHFDAGQFEAALGCGIFTPGQLKPSAVDEIISLVKPGKFNYKTLLKWNGCGVLIIVLDILSRVTPSVARTVINGGPDVQIELEFRSVIFLWREENRELGEKPANQQQTQPT